MKYLKYVVSLFLVLGAVVLSSFTVKADVDYREYDDYARTWFFNSLSDENAINAYQITMNYRQKNSSGVLKEYLGNQFSYRYNSSVANSEILRDEISGLTYDIYRDGNVDWFNVRFPFKLNYSFDNQPMVNENYNITNFKYVADFDYTVDYYQFRFLGRGTTTIPSVFELWRFDFNGNYENVLTVSISQSQLPKNQATFNFLIAPLIKGYLSGSIYDSGFYNGYDFGYDDGYDEAKNEFGYNDNGIIIPGQSAYIKGYNKATQESGELKADIINFVPGVLGSIFMFFFQLGQIGILGITILDILGILVLISGLIFLIKFFF